MNNLRIKYQNTIGQKLQNLATIRTLKLNSIDVINVYRKCIET